jgi:type I restriction-modification system DNA methylase subunit
MEIRAEDLRAIRDKASLFTFLDKCLNWPVETESEDPYTYDVPEVAGRAAMRVNVRQLVDFGANDPFAIFLVEFHSAFRRTDLREILRGIRREIRGSHAYRGRSLDELIFLCATEGYNGLRFVHFEEREGKQPRLRVFGFDRDSIGETATLRRVNLPELRFPADNVLGEADWDEGKKRWMTAWDVEKVTDDFFKEYKAVFSTVEPMIDGVEGDKRLFTQRLFNRLLFVQFLTKKGWLSFNGRKDYLFALRDAASAAGENLYRDRLYWLFFHGLGHADGNAAAHSLPELEAKRGVVPFLNGGLFEVADGNDLPKGVTIPNEAFDQILDRLFACYNFTISESTPDDVEVAVDPEMLGKVFEELVTGRHESGSYYTPRPIVAFMCREGLKGYLTSAVPEESADAIAALVDHKEAGTIANPEGILDALKAVRVVDPACGSGAYLLGMVQELVQLRHALFATKKVDPISDYRRKLEIIQNSLYGVDKDEFAVNTARLRLWLSLVMDYEGTTPEPLPNLDFKIEVGDSLSAPLSLSGNPQTDTRGKLIQEFARAKRDYADPYYKGPKTKAELKKQAETLREDIRGWLGKPRNADAFDWQVEFAEVFEAQEPLATMGGAFNFGQELAEPPRPGGFHIVLANPPYVRQELIKEQKPTLKQVFPAVYTGTADLYCYFYARALDLLAPNGMFVFISSNKWLRAAYGAKLRTYIANKCEIKSITDFGELPVFQAAATFPMIFIAQRAEVTRGLIFTQVKTLAPPYPDVKAIIAASGKYVPATAVRTSEWTLTDTTTAERHSTMQRAGKTLGEYVQGYGL